jgi:hypothetical protein
MWKQLKSGGREGTEMTNKAHLANNLQITPEQKAKVDEVSDAQIKEIDRTILENASAEWSKVARLALTTMIERKEGVTGLPELFYLERIRSLVKEGFLESRGDLTDMKASEVRLAVKK